MWMVAALAPALAAESHVPCTDADCAALERALTDAFADEGLYKLDWMEVGLDAAGQPWVTVASADEAGLLAIAPKSDAPIVRGALGYTRTVPLVIDDVAAPGTDTALEGFDAFLEIEGITGESGGGGGGGGDECTEVCICTEDGPECWWVC